MTPAVGSKVFYYEIKWVWRVVKYLTLKAAPVHVSQLCFTFPVMFKTILLYSRHVPTLLVMTCTIVINKFHVLKFDFPIKANKTKIPLVSTNGEGVQKDPYSPLVGSICVPVSPFVNHTDHD